MNTEATVAVETPATDTDALLSVREAAAATGLSQGQIRYALNKGYLGDKKHTKMFNGRHIAAVNAQDIAKYAAARHAGVAPKDFSLSDAYQKAALQQTPELSNPVQESLPAAGAASHVEGPETADNVVELYPTADNVKEKPEAKIIDFAPASKKPTLARLFVSMVSPLLAAFSLAAAAVPLLSPTLEENTPDDEEEPTAEVVNIEADVTGDVYIHHGSIVNPRPDAVTPVGDVTTAGVHVESEIETSKEGQNVNLKAGVVSTNGDLELGDFSASLENTDGNVLHKFGVFSGRINVPTGTLAESYGLNSHAVFPAFGSAANNIVANTSPGETIGINYERTKVSGAVTSKVGADLFTGTNWRSPDSLVRGLFETPADLEYGLGIHASRSKILNNGDIFTIGANVRWLKWGGTGSIFFFDETFETTTYFNTPFGEVPDNPNAVQTNVNPIARIDPITGEVTFHDAYESTETGTITQTKNIEAESETQGMIQALYENNEVFGDSDTRATYYGCFGAVSNGFGKESHDGFFAGLGAEVEHQLSKEFGIFAGASGHYTGVYGEKTLYGAATIGVELNVDDNKHVFIAVEQMVGGIKETGVSAGFSLSF